MAGLKYIRLNWSQGRKATSCTTQRWPWKWLDPWLKGPSRYYFQPRSISSSFYWKATLSHKGSESRREVALQTCETDSPALQRHILDCGWRAGRSSPQLRKEVAEQYHRSFTRGSNGLCSFREEWKWENLVSCLDALLLRMRRWRWGQEDEFREKEHSILNSNHKPWHLNLNQTVSPLEKSRRKTKASLLWKLAESSPGAELPTIEWERRLESSISKDKGWERNC